MWFFAHKSLPNLLFGVLCLPGDQSHPFAQLTINPLARCICWAGLLGRTVFPPWNEGPNFGSYSCTKTMAVVAVILVDLTKKAIKNNMVFKGREYDHKFTKWK